MVIEKKERLLHINRAVYLFGFVFSLINIILGWQLAEKCGYLPYDIR
jgi:hypothetical protein